MPTVNQSGAQWEYLSIALYIKYSIYSFQNILSKNILWRKQYLEFVLHFKPIRGVRFY